MLEIPKTTLSALEGNDTEQLREFLDTYQREHFFSFTTFETNKITDENKPFKHNMKCILNRFLSDAYDYMKNQISTGTYAERRRARRKHVTIDQLANRFIPEYFSIHALVRLARHLSLIVSDEFKFITMHAVENFNELVTFENADEYFDDWTCSIYLTDCSIYDETYEPFSNFPRNYRNCFTAWIFRCFEDNLTKWLTTEFNALVDNFRLKNPNLYNAFFISVQLSQ